MRRFFLTNIFFAVSLSLAGCSTEYNLATNKEETLLYGTEKEMRIGESIAQQFDANFKISTDIEANQRVQKILDRIVAVCDRQELVYTIKIIDEDELNAVSLPGGFIYVYQGLLDRVKSDDQLAAVIAHEIGHIAAKHAIKKLQSAYGYALLQILSVQTAGPQAARGVQAAYTTMFFANSQEAEFESDRLGIKYMKLAGYDPKEMTSMLSILREHANKEPTRSVSYWRTHPYLPERMAASNSVISGSLEFKDYLNLTGEK